jgi:hypothetical protein
MKLGLLISLFTLCSLFSFTQEAGYYGKNMSIEFKGMGQLPVFQNVFGEDKGYVFKNNELQASYNLKDLSFSVALAKMTNENQGYGLELISRSYQFNPLKYNEINRQYVDETNQVISQYVNAKAAFVPVHELTIMPKMIYNSNQSRLPVGFSNEFGIGYSIIRITNMHPDLSFDTTNTTISIAEVQKEFIATEAEELKGLVLMYGLKMNYPLTKSLLFSIGFRYQYNTLLNQKSFEKMEQTTAWMSGREVWSRINQRRLWGFFNAGVGMVYCF